MVGMNSFGKTCSAWSPRKTAYRYVRVEDKARKAILISVLFDYTHQFDQLFSQLHQSTFFKVFEEELATWEPSEAPGKFEIEAHRRFQKVLERLRSESGVIRRKHPVRPEFSYGAGRIDFNATQISLLASEDGNDPPEQQYQRPAAKKPSHYWSRNAQGNNKRAILRLRPILGHRINLSA